MYSSIDFFIIFSEYNGGDARLEGRGPQENVDCSNRTGGEGGCVLRSHHFCYF